MSKCGTLIYHDFSLDYYIIFARIALIPTQQERSQTLQNTILHESRLTADQIHFQCRYPSFTQTTRIVKDRNLKQKTVSKINKKRLSCILLWLWFLLWGPASSNKGTSITIVSWQVFEYVAGLNLWQLQFVAGSIFCGLNFWWVQFVVGLICGGFDLWRVQFGGLSLVSSVWWVSFDWLNLVGSTLWVQFGGFFW